MKQQLSIILFSSLSLAPPLIKPSYAGEVGARITRAVTTSDLGISVRMSVVKGAQMMDSIDKQWELFSDTYNLGSARTSSYNKKNETNINPKSSRLQAKVIPPNEHINLDIANLIIQICDETFIESINNDYINIMNYDILRAQIEQVYNLVRPSFERRMIQQERQWAESRYDSNVSYEQLKDMNVMKMNKDVGNQVGDYINNNNSNNQKSRMEAEIFNLLCYCHFKAYCDIINNYNYSNNIKKSDDETPLPKSININRKEFERKLGDKLLLKFAPSLSNTISTIQSTQHKDDKSGGSAMLVYVLKTSLELVDEILSNFVSYGFIASTSNSNHHQNTNNINDTLEESIQDWAYDQYDFNLRLEIDGDVTLNSQILLQELGLRYYPNFVKFTIISMFQQTFGCVGFYVNGIDSGRNGGKKMTISSDDYYMDTNYNSNPDLFEVKQILIDIVIESP